MEGGLPQPRQKLKVFITVDTEVWPSHPDWRTNRLHADIEKHLYGATPRGELGVRYQLRILAGAGLKAVFLIEPLFAIAAGLDPLRQLVGEVLEQGHEVGLHTHAEWVGYLGDQSPIPSRRVQHMKDLGFDDQLRLIETGLDLLRRAGAPNVESHRAGNYTANLDTLRALARAGVRIDTSYNFFYEYTRLGLAPHQEPLQTPGWFEGTAEYPVSQFIDRPGSYRHVQLAAVSNWEFEHTLGQAWRQGRSSYVIVSHSFELLKQRAGVTQPDPHWAVKRRFERLCAFLGANRDRFETALFRGLPAPAPGPCLPAQPLKSSWIRTGFRMVEQVLGDRL